MKRFCFRIIAYNKDLSWLGLMAKTCRAFHTMGCVACESLHFPSKALLCASNFTATATHATRESELEVEGLIDRLERNCSFNSTVQRWLLMQGRHRECAILPQRAFLHASADEKQIRRKRGFLPCLFRETKSSFLFQAAPMGPRCLLELFFLHRSSYLYHSLYRCTPLTIYGN